MLHAELAYIVNVAEPLANGVCRPRMGWGSWKVRGEGPKSLLFGGGARGGSGLHCKEDDHRNDTDNSYFCSNRIYMGPEKQTITFAKKMH